jgi:hypothetical protein
MMPMPKGATAWEKVPQRQTRWVFLNVFGSGLMVGIALDNIHTHRWFWLAWDLAVAALSAYNAWDKWRKIP